MMERKMLQAMSEYKPSATGRRVTAGKRV